MTLYAGALPKKISPQPIVTVEVAIAFSKPDDHAARLLRLHQAIAKEAAGMEVVPASRPPQEEPGWFPFAETSIGLRHSAAVIRPDSIRFDYGPSYPGWSAVRDELESTVRNLSSDLCEEIAELSLRYVNFFPSEPGLRDVVQLDVATPFGDNIARRWFRFEAEDRGIRHDITCAEGVSVESGEERGVILDIASVLNGEITSADTIVPALDTLHDQEKRAFMTMIAPDYLSRLEVEY